MDWQLYLAGPVGWTLDITDGGATASLWYEDAFAIYTAFRIVRTLTGYRLAMIRAHRLGGDFERDLGEYPQPEGLAAAIAVEMVWVSFAAVANRSW